MFPTWGHILWCMISGINLLFLPQSRKTQWRSLLFILLWLMNKALLTVFGNDDQNVSLPQDTLETRYHWVTVWAFHRLQLSRHHINKAVYYRAHPSGVAPDRPPGTEAPSGLLPHSGLPIFSLLFSPAVVQQFFIFHKYSVCCALWLY